MLVQVTLDRIGGGGLEAENGLALHQDDLVLRAEQLADLGFRAPEGVQEDRVVVVGDRAAERGERPGGGSGRPGGEGEVRIAHWNAPHESFVGPALAIPGHAYFAPLMY